MTDYKGKILKYIDSRNRVHLIFNHYDESMTQQQIHDEIESQFGLKYKLDKTNTAKTFFSTTDTTQGGRYNNDGDELYRFTQTGGINLTTKINNQTAITPQQLLNIFQNDGQELKHINMEDTLEDGTTANSQKLTGENGNYAVGSSNTLTAEKVHMVVFSNMEPPITNTAATQPVDGHAGGRFFITNYAYDDTAGVTDFVHSNVNWGKHGYNIQNNAAGTNLAELPFGDNRTVATSAVSVTTDLIMHRSTTDAIYSTELSTATPTLTIPDADGNIVPLNQQEQVGIIGQKPKCYFYMYTKEGDDMLVNNFDKEQNRLHLLVKPYLINPVSVVATTTEGLEAKVDNNNVANIAARKIISDNLSALKQQFDNLVLGMTAGTTIKALEDRDTALNNAIDTKEGATAASNARNTIDDKANSNSNKLQKHAEVIEAMSKTQNNYYNFEWTVWEKPIRVAVSKDSNNIITNLEKDLPQARVDNNNRKRELSTESEVSKLREDINKLTIINKSLIEIISEKL